MKEKYIVDPFYCDGCNKLIDTNNLTDEELKTGLKGCNECKLIWVITV